jgi:hypothetical protein
MNAPKMNERRFAAWRRQLDANPTLPAEAKLVLAVSMRIQVEGQPSGRLSERGDVPLDIGVAAKAAGMSAATFRRWLRFLQDGGCAIVTREG